MRRLILPLAIAATVAVVLSGCGQKGDLYWPAPTPPGTKVAPQGAHPAGSTSVGPAKASSTITPFNSVIHQ
jgi:predicted small lipoprotein YifL